jgi:RNA polymerase sigma-70 factor (ECF subfamily)
MINFDREDIQKLYQYAVSLCRDNDFSYDLVQSTLERCLKLSTLPNNKMSYARTVLRNIFIDHYRHQNKFPEDSYDDEIVSIDLELQSLERIMIGKDQLEKAWQLLKPFETEILFLWAVEGHTTQAISEQIGIPKGTVLARIHRLRKRLKEVLGVSYQGVSYKGDHA